MRIYADYDEEPQELFEPLTPELYAALYDLEMGPFTEDFAYYQDLLPANANILEIGCGTGRLSRLFAACDHLVTGIDLSEAMLAEAQKNSCGTIRYRQMDMRRLQLAERFDAIIIPYNTLNLLTDRDDILQTLKGCHQHLKATGQLLLQLYALQTDSNDESPSFQFQMFDRPDGGKIIKELIRKYDKQTAALEITERYKIRPMRAGQANVNYSHTMKLHRACTGQWKQYIENTGFRIIDSTASYSPDASPPPNMLLLHCRRQP